jgi:dTDP-4-dehydrorhamnose 3,5-epimerase
VEFEPAGLDGAWVLHLDRREDERGFFARVWSAEEFQRRGLNPALAQCSLSYNHAAGTLRGMHYQAPPAQEAKVVRCVRGTIHDVLIDLRPQSATFRKWVALELTAENRLSFYIPEGVAHGFLTLSDGAEVLYLISSAHVPALARGVRWDDPAFNVTWPRRPAVISDRDRDYPDFTV